MDERNSSISEAQLRILCDYLEDDCQMHLSAAHNKWHLDLGKLSSALELAGVSITNEGERIDR